MSDTALDRTEQFVGAEGQKRLRGLLVAIVGLGGLGTHVAQHLAFLRVGRLILIDGGLFKESSRNRYIGSRATDKAGTPKVDLAKRLILETEPATHVDVIQRSVIAAAAFDAIIQADYVFGCVDNDGVRFILNELCLAYDRPYFDLATEIPETAPEHFGGRVCISHDGRGCLHCHEVLDGDEVRRFLGGPQFAAEQRALYGVDAALLPGGGPAVVTLNGVVAALATTEFLVTATGRRPPSTLLSYRGHTGIVTRGTRRPDQTCYYCDAVRGTGDQARVSRYLETDLGS